VARPHDLLERMRRSKAGWHERDLQRLYEGFGFERREGGSHVLYVHPKYRTLRATVSRSSHLKISYFSTAVALIDTLLELEAADAH
jgi:predicted RNA binding protein YcfA (HicA-like mRNA interferase family)